MTGNAEGTRHAPGFPDLPTLRTLLADRYGVCDPSGIALRSLREQPRKRIYLVEWEAGRKNPAAPPLPWVLRVYGAGRPTAAVKAHAHVLQLLERHSYAAPRLVPAADGSVVTACDAESGQHPVLVATYIVGKAARFALPGLQAHGAMVGRLHALIHADNGSAWKELAGLPPAGMLPDGELGAAFCWLEEVRGRVPVTLRRRYGAMEAACHGLHRFRDAPRVLIHNDCHHWNSVTTADGRVVLIDWEGAGLGPAVIDLGFAALSVDTGGIVGPIEPTNPARLAALLAGYRQHHALTAGELTHLADAIRFRTLVGACANLAQTVRHGRADTAEPWWWQRYEQAEALADRVRAGLLA